MSKFGEGMMGKFKLGGTSAIGGAKGPANELTASQQNLNFGGAKAGGEMSTYRSNLGGVDKSMDNFKMGFTSQFGGQLGMSKYGQGHAGVSDSLSNLGHGHSTFGAV